MTVKFRLEVTDFQVFYDLPYYFIYHLSGKTIDFDHFQKIEIIKYGLHLPI